MSSEAASRPGRPERNLDQLRSDGRKYLDRLHEAQNRQRAPFAAPSDATQSVRALRGNFEITGEKVMKYCSSTSEHRCLINGCPLSIECKWIESEEYTHGVTAPGPLSHYENALSYDGTVLFAVENHRSVLSQTLHWNRVAVGSICLSLGPITPAVKGEAPAIRNPDLQAVINVEKIVHVGIDNPEWLTAWQYLKTKYLRGGKPYMLEIQPGTEDYFLMIGTPMGCGTAYLLIDHVGMWNFKEPDEDDPEKCKVTRQEAQLGTIWVNMRVKSMIVQILKRPPRQPKKASVPDTVMVDAGGPSRAPQIGKEPKPTSGRPSEQRSTAPSKGPTSGSQVSQKKASATNSNRHDQRKATNRRNTDDQSKPSTDTKRASKSLASQPEEKRQLPSAELSSKPDRSTRTQSAATKQKSTANPPPSNDKANLVVRSGPPRHHIGTRPQNDPPAAPKKENGGSIKTNRIAATVKPKTSEVSVKVPAGGAVQSKVGGKFKRR